MINKKFSKNQNILLLILFFFSIAINQYYGNRGIFPIEGTAFFDTAYRILLGDVPFKDYWLVSGFLIDYVQSAFFWVLGINFQAYLLHASLMNSLLTLMTFFFVKNLKLGISYAFFYSISFSILAYTTSGTLYVDNHASLLCLAATYCFINGIIGKEKKNFFLIPLLVGLAFLTKSAPTIYVFILLLPILIFYIIIAKKFSLILILFTSSIIFLIFTYLFIFFNEIPFKLILQQYFYFPMTIAENRFENFTISIKNIFLNFKFIYVFLMPIIIFNICRCFSIKKSYLSNDFFIFLSLLGLSLSLMFHQLNTKNQLFILFLIPILCAFLHSQVAQIEIKFKKVFTNLLIIVCIFFTIKYHLRYNESRKFHEMVNINFELSINANKIDNKLNGLNWITPEYKENPIKEIDLILDTIRNLKENKKRKMIISNYSFLSSILGENSNSPSRWYISNGAAYPISNNKYFEVYRNYLIETIKDKNLKEIFIIKPVAKEELFRYVNSECFSFKEINQITTKYELVPSCKL